MFGFKAYYWDDTVYINGRGYQTNEILTSWLNFHSEKDLRKYLKQLNFLLEKVQLWCDLDDYDYFENYNANVQRAQDLFFIIGNIVKDFPPYKRSATGRLFDAPQLMDCLNAAYPYWDVDDLEAGQFSNEYGFLESPDRNREAFYVQRFEISQFRLEDHAAILSEANQMIEELFNQYTTALNDILRIKAYSELLDGYIHSKNKFLTDSETAESFITYAEKTRHNRVHEKVSASGSMQMGHEVYRREDGKEKLCQTYTFDSLGAFLYMDFFRGLEIGYVPKRCDNCGKYFLLTAGKYSNYCERPLKDDPEKTCRIVGSRRKYDDKCKNDPIWLAYNRAYKAHYARYMKKKMTITEFEQWSRYAVELREKAEGGTLSQTEYERLLKI